MPEKPGAKTTVIFDFDGTLVDVQEIFLEILNTLAPEFGYAPIERSALPLLKTMSARQVLFSYLKISWWKFPRLERRAREEYTKQRPSVKFFPGVVTLMQTLQERGYRVGVVSSSAQTFIASFLEQAGIRVDFIEVCGIFGKAQAFKRVLREHSLAPAAVVYVGDEIRDVEACQKIPLDMIGVAWGLKRREPEP